MERALLTVIPWLAALVCFASCSLLPYKRYNSEDFPRLTKVSWQKKNVIVVLGMRTELQGKRVVIPAIAFPRILETARLYRDCKKASATCLILASGGDPAEHGVTESQVIRRDLIDLGIPKEDILTEEQSDSTYENAKFSKAILQKEKPDLTILVTSRPHLGRAVGLFEWFDLQVVPAPAEIEPQQTKSH